jgi:prepilin-type N-terminal cleavage/methylation domain-containing protein
MTRLRDEEGFTLVELLVSMVIGTIVILAAFMVLDATGTLARKAQDRVDATQRGRLAMDVIGSELRSQVCLPGAIPPMEAGAMPTSFIFYANLGDEDDAPTKRRIYVQGDALMEQIWTGTYAGIPGAQTVTWSASPAQKTLVQPVAQVGATPYFRFWGFDVSLPATINTPLDATPLSAADAAKVVQVDVNFASRPTRATAASPRDAVFQQSIFFRTADPMDPGKGPKCQ